MWGSLALRQDCLQILGAIAAPLLVAALLAVSGAAAAFDSEPVDPDRQIPFALAVRGGVSLGSYEAGFEWALLRYLKGARGGISQPGHSYVDLVATSGASAGSINAMVSTLAWCVDPENPESEELFPDSVSNNLLFDTWLGIGFEELLPEKVDSFKHYRADDGVLTRNAFRGTVDRIKRLLTRHIFRPGCEVRFGILVTRVDPAQKDFAGVRVNNQRFAIPLTVRIDSQGYARFLSCLVDDADPAFGNVMYLQGTPTGEPDCPIEHDTQAIVDAIEASSAFPIAFGRKFLRYCQPDVPASASATDTADRCPNGMRPAIDEFIDGGLFDNIPLGVAKALAEPGESENAADGTWEIYGRRVNYIYLDPTIRRRPESGDRHSLDEAKTLPEADAPDPSVPDEVTYGLRSQLRFIFGAISSGRDYELYSLLRSGEWTNQAFAISDQLQAALRERYPELETIRPEPERWPAEVARCADWFEGDMATASLSERAIAWASIQCIATGVYQLEQQYRGTPADQKLLGHAGITEKRDQLIDWMVTLADYLGEERLARAAGEAGHDRLGDRRILLSSRFSPVVGEMMGAFGGFVDRSFREYDYYAGVYDAVWGIANFLCERQLHPEACLSAQLRDIYLSLGIRESPPADTVFRYLLHREYGHMAGLDDDAAGEEGRPVDHRNMLAIANSLFTDKDVRTGSAIEAPTMTEFITRLVEQEYDSSDSSEFLQRIFRLRDQDELTWYYPLTLRASNRLLLLEREESRVLGGGEFYTAGLTLGAFYLHSYMREEELTLNVSTAPDFAWQAWLPDEIAFDVRHGGLDLSWYQGRQITRGGWRWDVKMTPLQLNHSGESRDDNVWFSQVDFLFSRRTHGALTAFGLGPSATYTWKTWPNSEQTTLGAVMYLGFLEDKLRLTIGKMSFRDEFAGDNLYINIGVNDVPGLVYWGWSGSRGSWWPFRGE